VRRWWPTAFVSGLPGAPPISVAVPVLTYAVAGDRVLPPLEKAKDWLTRNNAAVMAVVITVIGLALLNNGLSGL
jgi:Sap, sulfolipid-1-addressing protein